MQFKDCAIERSRKLTESIVRFNKCASELGERSKVVSENIHVLVKQLLGMYKTFVLNIIPPHHESLHSRSAHPARPR